MADETNKWLITFDDGRSCEIESIDLGHIQEDLAFNEEFCDYWTEDNDIKSVIRVSSWFFSDCYVDIVKSFWVIFKYVKYALNGV